MTCWKNEKVVDTKENNIVKTIGDKLTWCELWVRLMRIDQTNVVVPQLSHTLTYMNEFQIENWLLVIYLLSYFYLIEVD